MNAFARLLRVDKCIECGKWFRLPIGAISGRYARCPKHYKMTTQVDFLAEKAGDKIRLERHGTV